MSRPLRGGVDRNYCTVITESDPWSRPLRGGVDRNRMRHARRLKPSASPPTRGRGSKPPTRCAWPGASSRPLRGGVDRNATKPVVPAPANGRPLRGGVDRNAAMTRNDASSGVAPYAGAWIETLCGTRRITRWVSPPTRGRGSKPQRVRKGAYDRRSPPTRGRGSKHFLRTCHRSASLVAPYAGAWIETAPLLRIGRRAERRPLRGGVDRNHWTLRLWLWSPCRPLRGGVDRNTVGIADLQAGDRRPLRGGVDRNNEVSMFFGDACGRPLRGGVDRNIAPVRLECEFSWSPPTRGRGSKPRKGRRWPAVCRSPPTRGRGSKLVCGRGKQAALGRPLRGGVDRNRCTHRIPGDRGSSPPTRGRGSKHCRRRSAMPDSRVAPYAGAWIET